MKLNEDEKISIFQLSEKGVSKDDIAGLIGISRQTVNRYINKLRAKQERVLVKYTCKYCQKVFYGVYRKHYCSESCMETSLRKYKWSKEALARYYTDKLNKLQEQLYAKD